MKLKRLDPLLVLESNDSNLIALTSGTFLFLYDTQSKKYINSIDTQTPIQKFLQFSKNKLKFLSKSQVFETNVITGMTKKTKNALPRSNNPKSECHHNNRKFAASDTHTAVVFPEEGTVKVFKKEACCSDTGLVDTLTWFDKKTPNALRFSSSGNQLLLGGEESVFMVWGFADDFRHTVPRLSDSAIVFVCSLTSNQSYLVGFADGLFVSLSTRNFRLLFVLNKVRVAPKKELYAKFLSAKDNLLYSELENGAVQVFDLEKEKEVAVADVGRTNKILTNPNTKSFVLVGAFSLSPQFHLFIWQKGKVGFSFLQISIFEASANWQSKSVFDNRIGECDVCLFCGFSDRLLTLVYLTGREKIVAKLQLKTNCYLQKEHCFSFCPVEEGVRTKFGEQNRLLSNSLSFDQTSAVANNVLFKTNKVEIKKIEKEFFGNTVKLPHSLVTRVVSVQNKVFVMGDKLVEIDENTQTFTELDKNKFLLTEQGLLELDCN